MTPETNTTNDLSKPTFIQRRVIGALIRRNVQGWGRPLMFTQKRNRLGVYVLFAGVLLLLINMALFGWTQFFTYKNTLATLLQFAGVLSVLYAIGIFITTLPILYRAKNGAPITISGLVKGAVCNSDAIGGFPKVGYHYVTIENEKGDLKAYAVKAELHNIICRLGKKVTFRLQPGTEEVTVN